MAALGSQYEQFSKFYLPNYGRCDISWLGYEVRPTTPDPNEQIWRAPSGELTVGPIAGSPLDSEFQADRAAALAQVAEGVMYPDYWFYSQWDQPPYNNISPYYAAPAGAADTIEFLNKIHDDGWKVWFVNRRMGGPSWTEYTLKSYIDSYQDGNSVPSQGSNTNQLISTLCAWATGQSRTIGWPDRFGNSYPGDYTCVYDMENYSWTPINNDQNALLADMQAVTSGETYVGWVISEYDRGMWLSNPLANEDETIYKCFDIVVNGLGSADHTLVGVGNWDSQTPSTVYGYNGETITAGGDGYGDYPITGSSLGGAGGYNDASNTYYTNPPVPAVTLNKCTNNTFDVNTWRSQIIANIEDPNAGRVAPQQVFSLVSSSMLDGARHAMGEAARNGKNYATKHLILGEVIYYSMPVSEFPIYSPTLTVPPYSHRLVL